MLKGLIEELDEEYAGDNYNDRCTPAMEEAERTFLRVVFAEYECELLDAGVPTDCDVAMWVREHFPEWLDSGRVRIGPDS